MKCSKKSCKEFIEEVIVPIENKPVEDGNLYVLFQAFPKFDTEDFSYKEYEIGESPNRGKNLSVPSEISTSKWQKATPSKEEKRGRWDYYYLLTLSGLIWHGARGGKLYRAEYQGRSIKLEHLDFYFYALRPSEMENDPYVQSRVFIENCINLGIKTQKARITNEVKNWTPFLLWSFAIDCIERQCLIDETIPDIYRQGLQFARILAKYYCGINKDEMENFVQRDSNSQNLEKEFFIKVSDLLSKISEDSKNAYGFAKSLSNAFYMCFNKFPPFNPFDVAREAQVMCAWRGKGHYRNLYDYPGGLTEDDEERRISERIWLAFAKQELDWQVQHLNELIVG